MKKILTLASFAILCVFLFSFATVVPASGQDAAAADTSKELNPAEIGPKNKAFAEKFVEWKEFLKGMLALKTEFQTAKSDRQATIETEYYEKLKTGEKMQKEMYDLGIAAFEEAPYKNVQVARFLWGLLQWEYARDNYEKCFSIASKLIGSVPEGEKPAVADYLFGGFSALTIMELDKAEEWFNAAKEEAKKQDIPFDTVLQDFVRMTSPPKTLGTSSAKDVLYSHFDEFKKSWPAEQEIRKKEAEAPEDQKNPRVVIKTSKGDITVELFENEAPNAVASFISLVEKGAYSDSPFHRVLPGFMAQGGGANVDYVFDCECYKPEARKHFRGSLATANAGPNTNSSQFYMTFAPIFNLDGNYTVFGRIVDGIEVLAEIQRIDPEDKVQLYEPDKIIKAEVLSKRDHEYKPVTRPRGRF